MKRGRGASRQILFRKVKYRVPLQIFLRNTSNPANYLQCKMLFYMTLADFLRSSVWSMTEGGAARKKFEYKPIAFALDRRYT